MVYTFSPLSHTKQLPTPIRDQLMRADKHEAREPQACSLYARISVTSVCDPNNPSSYVFVKPSHQDQLEIRNLIPTLAFSLLSCHCYRGHGGREGGQKLTSPILTPTKLIN